jgi:uncharacterized spore protein YtfJ
MNIQELLGTISERLSATATVKNIYGDPVTAGDRTIIPIASVRYAFAGRSGAAHGDTQAQNSGGAGKVSAKPCGALEITPQGTRFVPFVEPKAVGIAVAVGVALGAIIASLTMSRRVEVVRTVSDRSRNRVRLSPE